MSEVNYNSNIHHSNNHSENSAMSQESKSPSDVNKINEITNLINELDDQLDDCILYIAQPNFRDDTVQFELLDIDDKYKELLSKLEEYGFDDPEELQFIKDQIIEEFLINSDGLNELEEQPEKQKALDIIKNLLSIAPNVESINDKLDKIGERLKVIQSIQKEYKKELQIRTGNSLFFYRAGTKQLGMTKVSGEEKRSKRLRAIVDPYQHPPALPSIPEGKEVRPRRHTI